MEPSLLRTYPPSLADRATLEAIGARRRIPPRWRQTHLSTREFRLFGAKGALGGARSGSSHLSRPEPGTA